MTNRKRDVYPGPGCEEALVVVPAVVVTAAIFALVVGVTDLPGNSVAVGVVALVAGIAGWIGIWETLSRLHPRLSRGKGPRIKEILYMFGPPLIALIAAAAVIALSDG